MADKLLVGMFLLLVADDKMREWHKIKEKRWPVSRFSSPDAIISQDVEAVHPISLPPSLAAELLCLIRSTRHR